jgi:hypothetical protein
LFFVPDFKEITLDEAFANIGNYDIAKSTKYLSCIQSHIADLAGDEAGLLNMEKMMVKVLRTRRPPLKLKETFAS